MTDDNLVRECFIVLPKVAHDNQFLSPPSIVIIDRHGEAHPLPFGIKSADELLQFIQPFLDEAM